MSGGVARQTKGRKKHTIHDDDDDGDSKTPETIVATTPNSVTNNIISSSSSVIGRDYTGSNISSQRSDSKETTNRKRKPDELQLPSAAERPQEIQQQQQVTDSNNGESYGVGLNISATDMDDTEDGPTNIVDNAPASGPPTAVFATVTGTDAATVTGLTVKPPEQRFQWQIEAQRRQSASGSANLYDPIAPQSTNTPIDMTQSSPQSSAAGAGVGSAGGDEVVDTSTNRECDDAGSGGDLYNVPFQETPFYKNVHDRLFERKQSLWMRSGPGSGGSRILVQLATACSNQRIQMVLLTSHSIRREASMDFMETPEILLRQTEPFYKIFHGASRSVHREVINEIMASPSLAEHLRRIEIIFWDDMQYTTSSVWDMMQNLFQMLHPDRRQPWGGVIVIGVTDLAAPGCHPNDSMFQSAQAWNDVFKYGVEGEDIRYADEGYPITGPKNWRMYEQPLRMWMVLSLRASRDIGRFAVQMMRQHSVMSQPVLATASPITTTTTTTTKTTTSTTAITTTRGSINEEKKGFVVNSLSSSSSSSLSLLSSSVDNLPEEVAVSRQDEMYFRYLNERRPDLMKVRIQNMIRIVPKLTDVNESHRGAQGVNSSWPPVCIYNTATEAIAHHMEMAKKKSRNHVKCYRLICGTGNRASNESSEKLAKQLYHLTPNRFDAFDLYANMPIMFSVHAYQRVGGDQTQSVARDYQMGDFGVFLGLDPATFEAIVNLIKWDPLLERWSERKIMVKDVEISHQLPADLTIDGGQDASIIPKVIHRTWPFVPADAIAYSHLNELRCPTVIMKCTCTQREAALEKIDMGTGRDMNYRDKAAQKAALSQANAIHTPLFSAGVIADVLAHVHHNCRVWLTGDAETILKHCLHPIERRKII